MSIPYKLFGHYLDTVIAYHETGKCYAGNRTTENLQRHTIASQTEIAEADSIHWPWNASAEQLREHGELVERMCWTDEPTYAEKHRKG